MNKHTLVALAACTAALGGTAARAATMPHELNHHAAQQARIAADEARGRLDPAADGGLHERVALVERVEADALAADNAASLRQLAYAERDLDRAIARAEHAQHRADALQRMHAQVADAREAEQQHWIATEYRRDKLDRDQTAALERNQVTIVTREAALERRGHESVDEALQVQHLQDVQDWAIRTRHPQA
ncbi:MAG TPA: hypothetical protein VML58_11335 [Burkholderiaceae bacterium]|nr:hypothetical protein [Burkholderiaceae bacterium]